MILHSSWLTDSVPSRRWARWISDALNPLVVSLYLLLILIWHPPVSNITNWAATLLSTLFFCLIPLGILFYFKRSGQISSLDIEIRTQRYRPYLYALFSYAAGWLCMAWLPLEQIFIISTLIGCYLVNSVIGLLLTLRWKISIHTASLTTVVSFSWLIHLFVITGESQPLYLIALVGTILLPFLMWSRHHLKVHSLLEIASGGMIALLLTVLETYLLLL